MYYFFVTYFFLNEGMCVIEVQTFWGEEDLVFWLKNLHFIMQPLAEHLAPFGMVKPLLPKPGVAESQAKEVSSKIFVFSEGLLKHLSSCY